MPWWAVLQDGPGGFPRIECPVVLAQGSADLVRFADPELPGAGHAPQSDDAEATIRLVLAAAAGEPAAARIRPGRPGRP